MGRLFSAVSALVVSAVLLLPAHKAPAPAQPVFFSMLFPQLVPQPWLEATAGEAVFL